MTGSTSFNGKDVAYELTGDSLSVTSSAKNGLCTVEAVVDGTKHRITVNASQLRWDKEKVALNGFTKTDITIDRNTVTIAVDGKNVIPKKKRRSTIHRVTRTDLPPEWHHSLSRRLFAVPGRVSLPCW